MIRPLKTSDISQVSEIYDLCGLPVGDLTQCHGLVFEGNEGLLLGFVTYHLAEETADIIDIGVAPSFQKRGVGAQLLTALFDHLRHLSANEVFLEVSCANEGALKLYEKVGFRAVGARPQYYKSGIYEGTDALVMSKKIIFSDKMAVD